MKNLIMRIILTGLCCFSQLSYAVQDDHQVQEEEIAQDQQQLTGYSALQYIIGKMPESKLEQVYSLVSNENEEELEKIDEMINRLIYQNIRGQLVKLIKKAPDTPEIHLTQALANSKVFPLIFNKVADFILPGFSKYSSVAKKALEKKGIKTPNYIGDNGKSLIHIPFKKLRQLEHKIDTYIVNKTIVGPASEYIDRELALYLSNREEGNLGKLIRQQMFGFIAEQIRSLKDKSTQNYQIDKQELDENQVAHQDIVEQLEDVTNLWNSNHEYEEYKNSYSISNWYKGKTRPEEYDEIKSRKEKLEKDDKNYLKKIEQNKKGMSYWKSQKKKTKFLDLPPSDSYKKWISNVDKIATKDKGSYSKEKDLKQRELEKINWVRNEKTLSDILKDVYEIENIQVLFEEVKNVGQDYVKATQEYLSNPKDIYKELAHLGIKVVLNGKGAIERKMSMTLKDVQENAITIYKNGAPNTYKAYQTSTDIAMAARSTCRNALEGMGVGGTLQAMSWILNSLGAISEASYQMTNILTVGLNATGLATAGLIEGTGAGIGAYFANKLGYDTKRGAILGGVAAAPLSLVALGTIPTLGFGGLLVGLSGSYFIHKKGADIIVQKIAPHIIKNYLSAAEKQQALKEE